MLKENQILGKLKENRRTITSIADECGCTRATVYNTIQEHTPERMDAKKLSPERYIIMRIIAEAIEKEFEDVWGVKDEIWYGKFLPGWKRQNIKKAT